MEWKKTDPRLSINKRANIVVVRPSCSGTEAVCGNVETKHVYCIWLDQPEDRNFIRADDEWPEDWWWTFTPE
jgi:hypothetical protein